MTRITQPFKRAGAWTRRTAKQGWAWSGRQGRAAMAWYNKKPKAMRMGILGGGAAVVLFVGLAVAGVFSSDEASAADLRAQVKANPQDANQRLALGHALFRDGKKEAALREYERALAIDDKTTDGELLANLTASFGDKEAQPMAAVLIVRHKLVGIEDQLDDRTSDERHSVRWQALYTLEKIGRASGEDEQNALRADLRENDCSVRMKAVTKLAKSGNADIQSEVKAAAAKNKACPRTAKADDDDKADKANKAGKAGKAGKDKPVKRNAMSPI